MYVIICDDRCKEILSLGRRSLFEVNFKFSPPRIFGDAYTIINSEQITFSPLEIKRVWANHIGVCQDADSVPFAIVPLENGHQVRKGETIAIAPGKLQFNISNIKPSGRKEPEPDPKKAGTPKGAKMFRPVRPPIRAGFIDR